MATANFAARGQPKLDFCRSWNVTFLGTSRLKNVPSANVLRFRFSKIPVSESVSLTTDLRREVGGKRDGINYGRPVNGWRPGLKNGLFIY